METEDNELPAEFAEAVEAAKVRKPRAKPVEAAADEPLLSDTDIEEAKARVRARFTKEAREAEIKRVMDAETARLRREQQGETADDINNEFVNITLDLAEHSANIMLDGNAYWHGQTYKVRRSVANTLREVMARGHAHQDILEGRDMTASLRRAKNRTLSGREVAA